MKNEKEFENHWHLIRQIVFMKKSYNLYYYELKNSLQS